MKKKLMLLINAAVSLAMVAVIIYFVGLNEMLQQIERINIPILLLSILLLFFMDLTMAYRILFLLRSTGVNLRFIDVLKAHFVGMLAADFTPARSGYFTTIAVLKYNYNVPSEKAMLSIFGPQIFDFGVKLVAGTIALFYITVYFLGIENSWLMFLGVFALLAIVVVMLLILFSERFLSIFSFVEKIPILSRLYAMTRRMQTHSHVITKKTVNILILIAFSWTFKALSWYAAAKSVGITINTQFPEVFFYFFLQPLVTILEFLPSTTIAGLGLSEGAITIVLSLFGISAANAMVFALVVRFKTTLLHLVSVPEALKMVHKPLA